MQNLCYNTIRNLIFGGIFMCVYDLDNLVGMDGERQLTWSDFWEEVAQAKEYCESESDLRGVIQNIIKYYNVVITVEECL